MSSSSFIAISAASRNELVEQASTLDCERKPLLHPHRYIPSTAEETKIKMLFCQCSRSLANRKIIVDFLAICFGVGAWIAINGMFVELPLLVQTQPEGWNLPSYLTVIIQIANVGPILYSLSQSFCQGKIRDSRIIYCLLIMGTIALLLMAFFYQNTKEIGGKPRSLSLFVLVFFIALVGCTSSVLFMPYMGKFRDIYLISYFVGEGLSGFLPSVVALGQGVGGNPTCVNSTDSDGITSLVPFTPLPNFSTQVFFFFLFVTLFLSTIAFFLLNNLQVCKSEKVSYQRTRRSSIQKKSQTKDNTGTIVTNNVIESIPTYDLNSSEDVSSTHSSTDLSVVSPPSSFSVNRPKNVLSRSTRRYLLILLAWVCLLGNGVFPSIQSYSCLPYGNVVYHLSATLGSMANPMACFLAFFLPISSVLNISILTTLTTAVSCYIMTTAIMSPAPPLVDTTAGEILVVLAWILNTGFISYVKLSIATVFRREIGRALFWCGAVQQMGSAIGAIVTFLLVNNTNLFTSYYPCQ